MNGRAYLLDTNIVIALLNGDLSLVKGRTTYLSSIVLGELHFGARKSGRVEQNLERLEEFASKYRARNAILVCSEATAAHYGLVKHQLRRMGRPIPENDIWLAAQGLEHELVIVSRDQHLELVPDLAIESW